MYYVYELIDPRDKKVFYVGKGKGNRIDCHEREALKGVSSHKCNKINSIIKSKNKIIKEKIAHFSSEIEAYKFEEKTIRKYGLKNLTNISSGFKDYTPRVITRTVKEISLKNLFASNRAKYILRNWCHLTDYGEFKVKLNEEKQGGLVGFCQKAHITLHNKIIPDILKNVSKNEIDRLAYGSKEK